MVILERGYRSEKVPASAREWDEDIFQWFGFKKFW
jgi:hypothetical protein